MTPAMEDDNALKHKMLRSFVPVNALTEDHLATLLRDNHVEFHYRGQQLFEIGDVDDVHIYLLHGELELTDASGRRKIVSATDELNQFPLCAEQPRQYTARAASDCSVVRFNKNQLDNMLCWDQTATCIIAEMGAERDLDEDAAWMVTVLKSNLFYKVPPMNIRDILGRFEACYVPVGEVIVRQGEVGDCCYVIKEGSAEVFLSSEPIHTPEKVAVLHVGRCFGEDALVHETVRNATVIMAENGVLMRLAKADFYRLLKQPEVQSIRYQTAIKNYTDCGQWLDVRTTAEFDVGHCSGAQNIPLSLITVKSRMLDHGTEYVCYCDTGNRSRSACNLLEKAGYQAKVLTGGIQDLPAEQRIAFQVKH